MSRHRRPASPVPARIIATGAALGVALGGGGLVGQAFTANAAEAARPPFTATDRVDDPVRRGGPIADRACRCTPRTTCTHPTEGDPSCPPHADAASANGPDSLRPTAPPVTNTSALSGDSTATDATGDAITRAGYSIPAAGTFSGTTETPLGSPGSYVPTESTPSTRNDLPMPPETTAETQAAEPPADPEPQPQEEPTVEPEPTVPDVTEIVPTDVEPEEIEEVKEP